MAMVSRVCQLAFIGMIMFCPFYSQAEHMYISGRDLRTATGEKVVLRGFNQLVVYWDIPGRNYSEITKTGANACRIFWETTWNTPTDLDTTLTACIANEMIPIIGLWDASGKSLTSTEFDTVMAYWTSPAVVSVLKKHEKYLLINIANEAGETGSWTSTKQTTFNTVYADAINQIRSVGIQAPLIIDCAGWGTAEEYIQNSYSLLLAVDPNLMFSYHMYDNPSQTTIRQIIDHSVTNNYCLYIGELS